MHANPCAYQFSWLYVKYKYGFGGQKGKKRHFQAVFLVTFPKGPTDKKTKARFVFPKQFHEFRDAMLQGPHDFFFNEAVAHLVPMTEK